MRNEDEITHLPTLTNISLNTHPQHIHSSIQLDKNRRQSIIPTSHLPKYIQQPSHMENEQLSQPAPTVTRNATRSIEGKKKRNRIRHAKMKIKRQHFTLKRPVAISWKPRHIKLLFKQLNIKPARILEPHKHILTVQFNNPTDRDLADSILSDDMFNVEHFHHYFPQEH